MSKKTSEIDLTQDHDLLIQLETRSLRDGSEVVYISDSYFVTYKNISGDTFISSNGYVTHCGSCIIKVFENNERATGTLVFQKTYKDQIVGGAYTNAHDETILQLRQDYKKSEQINISVLLDNHLYQREHLISQQRS